MAFVENDIHAIANEKALITALENVKQAKAKGLIPADIQVKMDVIDKASGQLEDLKAALAELVQEPQLTSKATFDPITGNLIKPALFENHTFNREQFKKENIEGKPVYLLNKFSPRDPGEQWGYIYRLVMGGEVLSPEEVTELYGLPDRIASYYQFESRFGKDWSWSDKGPVNFLVNLKCGKAHRLFLCNQFNELFTFPVNPDSLEIHEDFHLEFED